jgi:2-dehydro-3-deoxygluconokinase
MTSTAPKTEVVTFGETLGSFRATARITSGSAFTLSPAGAESNVAIALARLDHRVAWVGRVGADPVGRMIISTLRSERVEVSSANEDAVAATATMIVEDRTPLPPGVVYHRTASAGSALSAERVAATIAELQPTVVHFSGITPALSESAAEATWAGIRAAREVSALVSFDVNFRTKLWSVDTATSVLTPLARAADIVIASEAELAIVASGAGTAERAQLLLGSGTHCVVVKLGREGAESYDASGRSYSPAVPVQEIDSIGAGDAFVGGYLSAVLDGLDPLGRLERGCAVGAFAVSGRGDWERTPTRAELALLQSGDREASR